MKHINQGFTLIELMIVVAIIAILTAIGISVYQNSTAKAQLSESFTIADGLKSSVVDYTHQTGKCPTAGTGGLLSPTSYAGNYVASVSVSEVADGECMITAVMRSNTVARQLRGKQVNFTMNDAGGSLKWACSSDAPLIYLPQTCH